MPRSEALASVPFSECKSTHFCDNCQMFAQKSLGKFDNKLPLTILMRAENQWIWENELISMFSYVGLLHRAVRTANMRNTFVDEPNGWGRIFTFYAEEHGLE